MSSESQDPRALDLCAIGLGQGGGNLAAEWHRRGYRALLFNTARADFRSLSRHEGLSLPERFQIHIGIGGTDGAGKDPEYGVACLEQHQDEVRAAVEAQLAGADAVLLCSGLGGGTGSALHALQRILEPLELPLISVASLPADAESGITKVNAVRAANALVQAELHGRLFIDNERLVEAFPDVDVISYYPHVNAQVLGPLDALNRLNADPDLWSVRSFDGEDMRKVLLSGGVLQTHAERLDEAEPLSPEILIDVVRACVDGGRHLAPGLALDQCAYLALVLVGPERVLKATRIHVLDDAIATLKKQTGGGAVYEGLYVGDDETPLMAYVLSASLALPERVQDLLGAAHSEGGALMAKIQEEIPELEISPLEGLDLFRAPARRRQGGQARPASPRPRPLGRQLIDDPVFTPKSPPPRPKPRPDDEPPATPKREQPAAARAPEPEPGPEPEVTEPAPRPPTGKKEQAGEPERARPKPKTGPRPADDLVPRVGTGRHEEAPSLEATVQVDPAAKEPPSETPADISLPAGEAADSQEEGRGKRSRKKKGKPRSKDKGAKEGGREQAGSRPDLRPRVGTGRWDEEPSDDLVRQEPTEFRPSDSAAERGRRPAPEGEAGEESEARSEPTHAGPKPGVDNTQADREPASGQDGPLPSPSRVRAGTGRPEDDRSVEVTEAVAISQVDQSVLEGVSLDEQSGLFSAEDLPFEYDIADEADEFETNAALTRPVDEDAILAAEPERIPSEFDLDDGADTNATDKNPLAQNAASRQPTMISNVDDALLSSVVGDAHRGQGTGLQNVYEDLIDRFRQAPDRRGRERVARRLIDDSRSDDVEIRALAVWAMVKLEERGFRRALAKAANDENPEISKLALTGLERIGAR